MGNGRIVLKKIEIPVFSNYTEAEIEITLVSNGDPWISRALLRDPHSSAISMIDVWPIKRRTRLTTPPGTSNFPVSSR